MKIKILFIIIFIFTAANLFSQEYSFPLYLEDASGNRDTLYFGFDQNATEGVDEELEEINFLNQLYDSPLISFFTDGATNDEYTDLHEIRTPTYLLKHQYKNIFNGFYFEIGIINQNWPLTVSWNNREIIESDIITYSGNPDFMLLMTNFYPPGGWFDAIGCAPLHPCTCSHLVLTDTNTVTIGKNQLCTYQVNFSEDTVNLIYIGYIDKNLPINDIDNEKIKCWYNNKTESICFENLPNTNSYQIQLLDLSGKFLLNNEFKQTDLPQINVSQFDNGLYIIRLFDVSNQTLYSSFKIIKL